MTRFTVCLLGVATLLAVGCRSDLSQQLLERELRMQEDQIYQLQDELQEKCARLDRASGENTSLRRQLGVNDADAPARGFSLPGRSSAPGGLMGGSPAGGQPMFPPPLSVPGGATPGTQPAFPPPLSIPGSPPASPGGLKIPGVIAPPKLEGVPPLPAEPKFSGTAMPDLPDLPAMPAMPAVEPAGAAGFPPGSTTIDPAARPISLPTDPGSETAPGRRLSHEESLADAGRITHLVINAARTGCFDGNGDGTSDGLAIVVEPRDGDERLVTSAGDLLITVFDAAAGPTAAPVARWEIPSQEAVTHFRRTSRNRGLHFVLRWPGPPPAGNHLIVKVGLTTFDAATFQTDCTVAAQPPVQ